MTPLGILFMAAAALAIYAGFKNQNPFDLLKTIFGVGYTTTSTTKAS